MDEFTLKRLSDPLITFQSAILWVGDTVENTPTRSLQSWNLCLFTFLLETFCFILGSCPVHVGRTNE